MPERTTEEHSQKDDSPNCTDEMYLRWRSGLRPEFVANDWYNLWPVLECLIWTVLYRQEPMEVMSSVEWRPEESEEIEIELTARKRLRRSPCSRLSCEPSPERWPHSWPPAVCHLTQRVLNQKCLHIPRVLFQTSFSCDPSIQMIDSIRITIWVDVWVETDLYWISSKITIIA